MTCRKVRLTYSDLSSMKMTCHKKGHSAGAEAPTGPAVISDLLGRVPGVGARAAVAAVGLAAVLVLAGCERAGPTGGEVALGSAVEQARGHLAASLANAEAG